MNMSILIADDEPALSQELRNALSQLWPDANVLIASDGEEALHIAQTMNPHIAFLDIRMPGRSGLELARMLSPKMHIVFVTAYDAYALSAFDAGAIDYLLKPLDRLRLSQTITRLQNRQHNAPADLSKTLELLVANHRSRLDWIQASSGNTLHFVSVNEVIYFQSDAKYTKVVTAQQDLFIRKSLRELEEQLCPEKFWQIHRGVIVAVDRIDQIKRDADGAMQLKLRERDEMLPISQTYQFRFRQM